MALFVDNLVVLLTVYTQQCFLQTTSEGQTGLFCPIVFAKCILCTDIRNLLAGRHICPPPRAIHRVNDDRPNAPKTVTCADGDL